MDGYIYLPKMAPLVSFTKYRTKNKVPTAVANVTKALECSLKPLIFWKISSILSNITIVAASSAPQVEVSLSPCLWFLSI